MQACPIPCAGLRHIFLDGLIVEWLEFIVSVKPDGQTPEGIVVATFLHVISQPEMFEALRVSRFDDSVTIMVSLTPEDGIDRPTFERIVSNMGRPCETSGRDA